MIGALGRGVIRRGRELSYGLRFFLFLLRETFSFIRTRRISFRVLIMQIYFTGVEALPVVSLLSLGLGAVIIIQGTALLPQFLKDELLYRILILVIARELGPLLTAFVVISRSGSAITTELGNMVVNHEMEAYLSVGIHPVSQLGVPRLLGVSISMVLLTVYSNFFGLMGSLLVASALSPFPLSDFVEGLFRSFQMIDILASVIKSFVFGIAIAGTALYYGFSVSGAVTEVPVKTIKSIGVSIVLCIVADAIIILVTALLGTG